MDVEMGDNNMGANPENPEETWDPVLPSTSTQQPQPMASHTWTLALAVEAQALTSPALAITMAQIQEASSASNPTGTDDEKAQLNAYKGIMQGLHAATQTLSAR